MKHSNFPFSVSIPPVFAAARAGLQSCLWILSFLCVLSALCRGIQTLVPSVPDQIQALVGSCVIIPCSFTPPAPHFHRKAKKETVSIRLSFRGGSHFFPLRSTAFNSEDQDQMSREFHGRTALFGQITNGDCSLKIERIRMDDARVFEVALKRADDFLWGKPRRFNLDVVGELNLMCLEGRGANALWSAHVKLIHRHFSTIGLTANRARTMYPPPAHAHGSSV
uniref:Immunoglobulin V-set domain-containing protein n=1 Tax=Takifugu rubripes TaxID=31033 RepID=A0A674NHX4_TAKRU